MHFALETGVVCSYIKYRKRRYTMTTTTLNGFIARETSKAIAFVTLPAMGIKKPLWIPRAKIANMYEPDLLSIQVQLEGEQIRRIALPIIMQVDAAFLEKVTA